MKALVYTRPNEVQLHDRPRPELASGFDLQRTHQRGAAPGQRRPLGHRRDHHAPSGGTGHMTGKRRHDQET